MIAREVGVDPRLTTVPLTGDGLAADTCLVALPERAELGVVRALFELAGAQAAVRTS